MIQFIIIQLRKAFTLMCFGSFDGSSFVPPLRFACKLCGLSEESYWVVQRLRLHIDDILKCQLACAALPQAHCAGD